jgi:hypothetical protein
MAISDNPILTDDQKRLLAYFRSSPLFDIGPKTIDELLDGIVIEKRALRELQMFIVLNNMYTITGKGGSHGESILAAQAR